MVFILFFSRSSRQWALKILKVMPWQSWEMLVIWYLCQDKLYDLVRSDVNKYHAQLGDFSMTFLRWNHISEARHAAVQQGHLQEMEQKVDKSLSQMAKCGQLWICCSLGVVHPKCLKITATNMENDESSWIQIQMLSLWDMLWDRSVYMDVSKKRWYPKSSILIGFSIIAIHFGVPLFLEAPIYVDGIIWLRRFVWTTQNIFNGIIFCSAAIGNLFFQNLSSIIQK